VLGDIKHIRALWHRNQSNPFTPDPKGPPLATGVPQPTYRDSWFPPIYQKDFQALAEKAKNYGYKNIEELVRWRLYNRTGGGLMAELGSHQLDACSIFLGKVHPLAVSGVGTKSFFRPEREVDDHVFVTFEFPGKNYYGDPERKIIKDKDDVVVVMYSSISTNSFEKYGECVMGTGGTMIVEEEQNVMLHRYGPNSRSTAVTVSTASGQPVLDTSGSTGGGANAAAAAGQASLGSGPLSRGYREEMEHFAYCVRMWDQSKDKKNRPL